MKDLILCTGNIHKYREFLGSLKHFTGTEYKVQLYSGETFEVQDTPERIVRIKADFVRRALLNGIASELTPLVQSGAPILCEDVNLDIDCLSGFPGPYVKFFVEKLTTDGISELVDRIGTTTEAVAKCYYACCTNYHKGSPNIKVFLGQTVGKIVKPRGPKEFGFDCIFEPIGQTGVPKTMAEMSIEDKLEFSPRMRAIAQLGAYLNGL